MKRPLFILAIVSVLWGSEWLLDSWVSSIPHFRLLALRCLIAGIVLVPFAFRIRRSAPLNPIHKSVLLGIVIIVLPTLFLASRTDLSPGLVVVLFAMLPLIVSIFEDGRGLGSAGVLIGGLGGTAFLVRGGLSFSLSQFAAVLILLPLLIALAAMLVRAKHWLSITSIPSSVMVQMFTAAVAFGACSILREGRPSLSFSASEVTATIILGACGGALAYSGYYWLLRHTNPSQAATVQWLVPVVGVIESAIWLRHLPPWDSILGGIVSVTSAILFFRSPLQGDGPLTLQITDLPQPQNASLRSGSS